MHSRTLEWRKSLNKGQNQGLWWGMIEEGLEGERSSFQKEHSSDTLLLVQLSSRLGF